MNARLLFLAALALLVPGLACRAEPRPLSIEEALALSLDNAEAVRIKAQAVEKSRSRLSEARAKARPTASLEAIFSYLVNPPEGVIVHQGELGTLPPPFSLPLPDRDIVFLADTEHTYLTLDASIKQPVFTWGKISSGIRLAALNVASSRAELELQRRDIRRETRRAYTGVSLARLSLPVLEEMRSALLDIVTDREHAFQEGLDTRQSLLEAKAGLAAMERRLVEARESELTALESLRLLTGLQEAELALTTPLRDAPETLEEQELLERALARSADLDLARTRVSQAQEKVRLERGGGLLRPDFSLSLSLEVTGQKPPWLEDWSDTWEWDVILSLGTRVKLYDGGEARARVAASSSDLAMAAYGAAQAEKLLRLGVRQAVQEARQAASELAELESRLEAAAEQHHNAQVSFENTLITREELRSALLALDQVRLGQLAARQRLELGLIELERLAGPLP